MKYISIFAALTLSSSAFAQGSHYVDGHYRNDGTYVQPHYRTNPDGNINNNWSTKGNVNPYTGKEGSVDPYNYSGSTYGRSKRKSTYGY